MKHLTPLATQTRISISCESSIEPMGPPFCTLKDRMGATHFLTRGQVRLRAEMGLHALAYIVSPHSLADDQSASSHQERQLNFVTRLSSGDGLDVGIGSISVSYQSMPMPYRCFPFHCASDPKIEVREFFTVSQPCLSGFHTRLLDVVACDFAA